MLIALLENDPSIRDMLEIILSLYGHAVSSYPDVAAFLRSLGSTDVASCDVLLADLDLSSDLSGCS